MEQNIAMCMHTMHGFGYDKIYNICKGTDSWVQIPWSSLDWIDGILVSGFSLAVIAAMVSAAVSIVKYSLRNSMDPTYV